MTTTPEATTLITVEQLRTDALLWSGSTAAESLTRAADALAVREAQLDRVIDEARDARAERDQHHRELESFRAKVRDAAIDHAEAKSECNDGLNEWLEALGLDPVTAKFNVTVNHPWRGTTLLEVEVEEDEVTSEEEAVEWVRERLEVSAYSVEVEVEVDYEGDTERFTSDDSDAVDEDWLSNWVSELDISAERA